MGLDVQKNCWRKIVQDKLDFTCLAVIVAFKFMTDG